MLITRRSFTGGALSSGLATQFAAPAFAQDPKLAAALAAIRAYGQAHLDHFRLPGLTLGVTTPAGFSTVMNFGFANADARTPITPDTLFQIGSISKLMTAALLHQFASEGQLSLTDRIERPAPDRFLFRRAMRSRSSTCSTMSPEFPAMRRRSQSAASGPLMRPALTGTIRTPAMRSSASWSSISPGKPLAQVVEKRLFTAAGNDPVARGDHRQPIGCVYAQGYEAADELPFALGVPLAPAAWVDVTFGAGEVASTADDMTRLLRSLANAVQGRGGLGLSPDGGRAFAMHAVPSDSRAMSYGNGLMHVGGHSRSYLHHTGGMVSFSSSFHVDVASGVGAFASSTLSAFAEYRPRLLTQVRGRCADQTRGRAAPSPSPPPLQTPLANAATYVGQYAGPAGAFEVRPGTPLAIVANGQSAALHSWDDNVFRTTHPAFRDFSLMFERKGNAVTGAKLGTGDLCSRGKQCSGSRVKPAARQARRPLRQRQPMERHGPPRRARRPAVARNRDSDDRHRQQLLAHWR